MLKESNDNKENIKVIVRIRPKIEREYDQNTSQIKVDGNSVITLTKNETKQYNFDYIATEESSQAEIFDQCARGIADSTLQGYNGTIFVYGQTGAGKSYTLLGPKFQVSEEDSLMQRQDSFNRFILKKEEESKGILPRAIEYLFDRAKHLENSTVNFSCSFLEIYQEQISDLLDLNVNKQIQIRDLSDSVIIEGLSKLSVSCAEEALMLVNKGIKSRHVASTNMNNESSRSHAVFSIYIENKTKTIAGKYKTKKSVFHLIDLAGSERQKMTDTYGDRLKEAGKINKSLMQLGHVIKNLIEIAEGKARHIHYRDSKLTHLLKDSLGGNSKTCIIANISPANCNLQESISTLVFAQSAKMIKNKAVINEETTNDNAYREEIKKLRDKYNSIKSENLYLMSIIEKNKTDGKLPSRPNDFTKTLDFVEEELETMVHEMVNKEEQIKILQNDNAFLREKIQNFEIELKLKEKEMRELKEWAKTYQQEHDMIKHQLREYVLKDAYLTQQITKLETMLQNKEFLLNKEIESLKSQIDENKRLLESKECTISSLNTEIKNLLQLINQKDTKINELKTEISNKERENESLRDEISDHIDKQGTLIHQIEVVKSQAQSKDFEIKLNEEKLDELRKKGRNVLEQYEAKMDHIKLEKEKFSEDLMKARREIKNLNLLINEIKRERDLAEEKSYKDREEAKRTNLEKEKTREELYRLLDDNKTLRSEMQRLQEDNELLSDNRNVNSNKVSLLNKMKQENTKLKEELNEARKTLDYLEKNQFKKGTKVTATDYASIMTVKEAELNECRRIMHNSVMKIKQILEMSHDEFTYTLETNKNFIEGKSLEEKFSYYLEKLISFTEVNI
jgi:kinesin family protein 15